MYASCFITGEQRRYKDNTGSYGRNKTIKHWRAWEVAIRYSDIDLNDDVIAGGKTSNTILDINWYSTKKTRFTMTTFLYQLIIIITKILILELRAQIDF